MRVIKHKALPENVDFHGISEKLTKDIEKNSDKEKSFFDGIEKLIHANSRISRENPNYSVVCYPTYSSITGETDLIVRIKLSEKILRSSKFDALALFGQKGLINWSAITNKNGYYVYSAEDRQKIFILIEENFSWLEYSTDGNITVRASITLHAVNPNTAKINV